MSTTKITERIFTFLSPSRWTNLCPHTTDPSRLMNTDSAAFIRANTTLLSPPLVPEVKLHLAGDVTPLWEATEAEIGCVNPPPPYWGYAWPGGQAVARFVLDRPELVAGKRVLDFAAGSGVVGIAAALRGGAVRAAEIDRLAVAAITLNAALNSVELDVADDDVVGRDLPEVEVVLAGDVCYERPMAERVLSWLRLLVARGCVVLLGDPGRAYLPGRGVEALATYTVPTSLDLEDREERITTVYRLLPG